MSLQKNQKRQNNLGTDNIKKLVPRLAIPAMLAQFVNVLYSIVDRIYIGNIPEIGEVALAGAGICGPIVTMISAFAAWIGIGGAPLMSIRMGEGKEDKAKQILANAFILLVGMSVLLTAAAYMFKDELLMKFGATQEIFPHADAYISVYIAGTVFAVVSLGLNQFIICQGFAKQGMYSVVIGAICNIVLDPIFIFGLKLGVSGAAIATVLSQMVSCIFTLCILFGQKIPIGISFGGYRAGICFHILVIGFTPFSIILFDNILIIIQNVMLKQYGGSQGGLLLTCNAIVQSFMLMVTMPLSGITGGTQSILGFNYGAGNKERIKQAEKEIIKTGLLFCLIMFVIAQFASGYFVGLFTGEAIYLAKTVQFIKIYTLGIIPLAIQYAIVDGFTGMGIAKLALPLSFFRKTLYIVLVIMLCITGGAELLFWAEPVSDVAAAIVSGITFIIVLPKLIGNKR